LSTTYTIFKKPHEGYKDLKTLNSKLKQQTGFTSDAYYFINNDTKTNFALINQFNTAKLFINLDTVQKGFKPFIAYQDQHALSPTTGFKNGWLVVSEDYSENRNTAEIESIKQLLAQTPSYSKINKTSAYWVNSQETVEKIMNIINVTTTGDGCK
jgi:hypothetical protein